VRSGVESICVKVDSSNLVAELDEGNNNACKDFSRYLDSDKDGLTDYEEIHGMRVAFPYAYVTTDPFDPDSDDDDLTDGEEMGRVVYDSANKVTYDVLRAFNWPEYDGYHYEYRSDPWAGDIDGDGLEDEDELEAGTNPFKKDDPFLVEAVSGFVLGDIGLSNPKHANTAYLGGSIASGLVPVVEWVATVRDVIANSWRGDWGTAGITAGTGLLSALPATVVADEVPEMAAKLGKFVRAYPGKVTDVAKYIVKTMPDHSIRLLDEILSGLKGTKGYDDLVYRISKGDVGAVFEAEVAVTKNANNVEWLGKPLITPFGSTDIDVLLKDGTIIEAKSIDWTKVTPDSNAYNLLKSDLGSKIKKFDAYDPAAKKVIAFKGSVDPTIKTWLETEKKVIVEVIP
jgi:hypothetical protein